MAKDRGPGITEAHVRITLALLNSPAFIALDYSAKALFLDMRSRLRSTNNGNLNASFAELVHRGWNSPTTLAKALRQLEAVGLLRKTRQTIGVERGSKVCNLYRFTDVDVYAMPKLEIEATRASHEWKSFTTLRDAEAAVRAASEPTKKQLVRNKTSLQKVERDAPDSVVGSRLDAPDSGVTPLRPTPKSGASAKYEKPRIASAGAGSRAMAAV